MRNLYSAIMPLGGYVLLNVTTFLATLSSIVTNASVQFVGSCKCTFVLCCPVRLLFDFTCYFIVVDPLTRLDFFSHRKKHWNISVLNVLYPTESEYLLVNFESSWAAWFKK